MLENLFTNVFGRPKNKSGGGRNSQHELPGGTSTGGNQPPAQPMTGPFSTFVPQMPQPPNLPYPVAPYPSGSAPTPAQHTYYPSLPFSQPPSLPPGYGGPMGPGSAQPHNPYGTSYKPLESVPFEAKLTLNSSTNLVSLDQLFREIKRAGEIVERTDAYLKSSQSDYDFKIEQGLLQWNRQ